MRVLGRQGKDLESFILDQLVCILRAKNTPVLYTSRGELEFHSSSKRIQFGVFLAEFMAHLAGRLVDKLGYIISKGGITTNLLLDKGLQFSSVRLKGQILPGLSVVCSEEGAIDSLPIITFPGNLGDKSTLLQVWNIMES